MFHGEREADGRLDAIVTRHPLSSRMLSTLSMNAHPRVEDLT